MKKLLFIFLMFLALPLCADETINTNVIYNSGASLTINSGVVLAGTWDFTGATVDFTGATVSGISASSIGWSGVTGTPTTLAGYGITDAQPLDLDLSSLASASATDVIYYRSGPNTWSPVTIGAGLAFSGGALSASGLGDTLSTVSTSVDGEMVLFSGTDGKHIKRATSIGNGLVVSTAGVASTTANNSTNWDTAYTDRLKWDGGSTGLVAATGRTSLGATTVGSNLFTLTNPGAISFLKINADNTVTTNTASAQRTDLGLAIGTNVEAWDTDLDTWATLTPSANFQTMVPHTFAQMRTDLGLVIGTNVQAWDTDLDTWATVTPSTVGRNIASLTNPSAISFLRINADNTVTARSAANFKLDLSLTASDVGLGSVTNDTQTQAAIVPNTAPSSGQILIGNAGGTAYAKNTLTGSGVTASLSSAGVLTLSAIPNSTLSNSSITIGGASTALGGTVTASTILDSLGSTQGQVAYRSATGWTVLAPGTDGNVLTTHSTGANPTWAAAAPSADNTAFASSWSGVNTIPPSKNAVYNWGHTFDPDDNGKVNVLDLGAGIPKTNSSGVLSLATANIDFAKATQATFTDSGSTGTPLNWSTTATTEQESAALTADRYALLPAASSFSAGTIVTYIDNLTTGNFGRNFRPANNGDTLDGLTYTQWNTAGTWTKPFIAGGLTPGQGNYQFKTDGSTSWVSIYADGSATKIQDTTNALKSVGFDVSGQAPNSGYTIAPATVGNSVTVVPDATDAPGQALTSVNADGSLGVTQVLPDPTSLADGRVLTVSNPTGTAGVWVDNTIAQSITGWTSLDASGATITWTPVAGQGQQNAYIASMSADRALTINTTGLQSGQTFNLIVQQDGTGGHVLTFTTPTQFLTPSNGLGTIQQTLSANAIDYYELKYTGVSAFPFIVSNAKLNLTSALPPSCSTTGSSRTIGTTSSGGNILSTSGSKYKASNFVASETSICRIDVPLLQVVGTTGPNYALHAAIYTDAVRSNGTYTSGVTTSGSSTVTDTTANWTSTDLGQRITLSAGFAAGTYYIGTVNSATSVTITSDKAGTTPVNATSSQTGVTTATYGIPGTIIDSGTGSTNSVNASSLPTTVTAANAAPTSFTGLTATGLVSGTTYHIVIWGDGSPSSTDFVQWVYDATVTQGYSLRSSATATTAGSWSLSTNKVRARYQAYH